MTRVPDDPHDRLRFWHPKELQVGDVARSARVRRDPGKTAFPILVALVVIMVVVVVVGYVAAALRE